MYTSIDEMERTPGGLIGCCRFCKAYGVQPVAIVSTHGASRRTELWCPRCGNCVKVHWSKSRGGSR